MHKDRTPQILQRELAVLHALCAPAPTNLQREAITRQLSMYVWIDAEHRVVFEAIARLCSSDPSLLREQLPAQATRMGFPDVSWENYFVPQNEPENDIEALAGELTATSAQEK
jgi:hypothetical protein